MNAIYSCLYAMIFLCGAVMNVKAQSGIYMTADDFEKGHLAYREQPQMRHAIRTDIPLNNSIVKVVNGNESVKLIKVDIFGYRNRRNEDFRFYDDIKYRILDASHIYLYSREVNVVRGKAKSRVTKYYFSRNGEAPVMELTMNNVKRAFPENRQFHDLIDLQFRSDSELLKYDAFHKEYKLQRLLEISSK